MNEIIVETQAVSKNYRKFTAIADMSIRVDKGDIYALIGQNGAGKTTLLKMLCGLTPPDSGRISLFAQSSAQGLVKARARTGAMVEMPAFLPYLSAKDNLEYLRIQRGNGTKESAAAALDTVGLGQVGKKPFGRFSLGMKQRLGLAAAVMDGPELLILDEPINGLDPMGIKEFRDIILRMNKESGTTVLISSHILGELSLIATDYGFIDHGKLIEHLTAEELMEKCRSVLCIDVDDTSRASEILREKLGCKKFTCAGNTLRIEERTEEAAAFVRALMEGGINVMQFSRENASLEEYFINLIGGGKANA